MQIVLESDMRTNTAFASSVIFPSGNCTEKEPAQNEIVQWWTVAMRSFAFGTGKAVEHIP